MTKSERSLVLIGDALPRLRADIGGARKERFERLHDEYRRLRTAPLSVEPPPQSVTYVGIHAVNLSLLYLLTEREEYLAEARRWIGAAVRWQDWGHAFLVNVDLSAAWLLWGLGLSFDWIKDALPAEERAALKAKLLRQGRLMYDFKRAHEGEGWPTNYWQNHNWINMNGLAAAGYALLADGLDSSVDGDVPRAWTVAARENFEKVYAYLADDGSDYEGVVYWRYGTPWLFAYADLAREREGVDFFATPFLRNTFWYRLHQAAPNMEETFNFGDCHDTRSAHSAALYFKFAAEYRIPQARWLADQVLRFLHREHYESGIKPGILSEAGLEYLWFDPTVEASAPDAADSDVAEPGVAEPTARFFPDLGLLCARDGWDADATALSIKCGAPGGEKQWRIGHRLLRETGRKTLGLSHQHPDNLAFILFSRGSYLCCDEGYNREVRAAHHNLVTVDNQGYRDEGQNNIWKSTAEDRIARLRYCRIDGAFVAFSGDAAACYADDLEVRKAERAIVGGDHGYWVVIDLLETARPRTFQWHLHAESAPTLIGAPTVYRWKNGNAALDLFRLYPVDAAVRVETTEVRSIMTAQEPDKLRVSLLRTFIAETGPATTARFIHILSPFGALEERGVTALQTETPGSFIVRGDFGADHWSVEPDGSWNVDGERCRSSSEAAMEMTP